MKIPFDSKYRPEIESGEYKVVTKSGKFARVICWDRKGNDQNIVVLVDESGWEDSVIFVEKDGVYKGSMGHDYDLFVITPEPELTEFEQALADTIGYAISQSVVEPNHETYKFVKDWSERLLDAAKKELCKGCAANLEGYIKGRQDALKEMRENGVYKYEGPTPPAYWPSCRHGGYCTNPSQNCFTCPRGSITVGFNTPPGTTTAKVEEK